MINENWDLMNLIERCFDIDLNKRPSSQDIMDDPFFKESLRKIRDEKTRPKQ